MLRRRRGYVSSSHPSDTFPLQWPALEGPEATAPQHVQLGLSLEPLGAFPAGTNKRKQSNERTNQTEESWKAGCPPSCWLACVVGREGQPADQQRAAGCEFNA